MARKKTEDTSIIIHDPFERHLVPVVKQSYNMKIDLEVLASTAIKRKKPWPRIVWVGEEQESLLLLDAAGKRISVLYVPSGKTKRKLNKLSPIMEQVKQFTSTRNGRYLIGLLVTGDMFVWYKDKDIVKLVTGLNKLTDLYASGRCHISVSDDCRHVFVVMDNHQCLLWIMEKGESLTHEKDDSLRGSWHRVSVPDGMDLPTAQSAECSVASIFYESPVLGHCFHCSLVSNKTNMLTIATLILKFPDPVESFGQNLPLFSAEWSLLEYPFQQMHEQFEAVSTPGAYVSSYCSNGQVLAVAANQRHTSRTAMLFVSPLTDTVLVAGMRNCGVTDRNKTGRQYWVADIAWTCDSLFLACMLKNGSVCLIPRLGEPMVVQTDGYSVSLGPSYFIAPHPAIFLSDNQGSLEPSAMEQDPMQQQFSLATHPSLPIILFSDGFLVTVVQLPVEMTPVTLMRGLVLESARYLKKLYQQENLDMTVADAYKLSKGSGVKGSKQHHPEQRKPNKPYEFELAEISLNSTLESDVSLVNTTNKFGFDQFGAIGNMDAGKIVFGEPEMITIDLNATFSGLEASESLLRYLEESMTALTSTWKLAVSYSDIWTSEVDNIAKQAVHNLSKIFSIVLSCPTVDAIIPVLTPRQSSAIQNRRVYNVIVAYRNILQLLRFDTFNQHLIPATLRLIHKTITLMLSSKELEKSDPRLKTLFGCFSLLKHAETSLNRVYVWVPTASQSRTPTSDGTPRRFEPAVMVKMEQNASGSSNAQSGLCLNQKGQLPGKRLAATWKLLYRHIVDYQGQVVNLREQQGDLPHLEKLMFAVQQVLQESDTEITPRRASAKLSTVWLRHACPFDLLSESDSFLYTDEPNESSPEPHSTLSPSPNNSSFKMTGHSSIQVGSYTSSPKGSSACSSSGNLSPTAALQSPVRQPSPPVTPRAIFKTALRRATKSKKKSGHPNETQFGLFNKIKSVVYKPKMDASSNASIVPVLQIDSMSSSEKVVSAESSPTSPNSQYQTALQIHSYSSSLKERSSQAENYPSPKGSSSGYTTISSNGYLSSSAPVITLDSISEKSEKESIHDSDQKKMRESIPKSEGFEILVGTAEFEISRSRESMLEHSDNQELRKPTQKFKYNSEKLSVDGEHSKAVEAWKEQLKILAACKKDSPKTARMLHSVLYTYLLQDELDQAVDFIDSLILQASTDVALSSQELPGYEDGARPPLMTLVSHRSQDSEDEELVPCIKNKSIRQTVQTMARYMAAYFSNETMYIFPPHSAQAISSVHLGAVPTRSRIIPKYHEDITSVVTQRGLSSMWTTERTVEYLLLSGLICETAWFAYKMGDWKTAYLLSVSHTCHRDIAQQLYKKPKSPLQLPADLTPQAILQEKLEVLIKSNRAGSTAVGANKQYKRCKSALSDFLPINQETNITQLTRTLEDILTAGIVCEVELAPWLLTSLTAKLKSVVANLPSLVPQDFYLPAPPLYCPQAGEEELAMDPPDVQYERELRMEISSIIQLILVSLNSSHLSLPSARWYTQELFKVQERAAQFKAATEGPCLELPEVLQQYKILRSKIVDYRDDPQVNQILVSFRDFCAMLWLLTVRDELSIHLRKRGNRISNDEDKHKDGQESPESTLGQEYVQECFKILKWAVHLLGFTRYIADDGWVHKVILSLILELPATEDTADILAEHFYDVESFDAEIQEKLERLLAMWQSVEILPEDDGKSARRDDTEEIRKSLENEDDTDDGSVRKSVTFYQASPRAKTLSIYFHKQCEVVQKVLKKKRKCFGQYEEFVFNGQEEPEASLQSGTNSSYTINIGSRPFETKQSYIEFLDRFYAICFTKVIEKESEGGKDPMHAILMPFSRAIREAEFEKFISKHEQTYQKKRSSVVMSSPRAKFFRSQSESQVNDADESRPSPGQRKSLFRSSSSGDMRSRHNYAGMARYESEGSLMNKNTQGGRGKAQASPTRGKPSMTGMASRFFQSEEVLYRDPGDSQEAHWILDVNFGHQYLAIQQLLEYLNHWGSKQHSLGLHGKSEKDLGMKPTMRIEVPTQLVVLGLWLLEHKYSSSKQQRQATVAQQEALQAQSDAQADEQQTKAKLKALATVEELTERDSFTQVSNIPRSSSRSPRGRRSRSYSPAGSNVTKSEGFDVSKDRTLASLRSFTSTQEETEQVKSAYKKVLDGVDDSSSLEVSSLEPDDLSEDLKRTLSALGQEGVHRSRSPKQRRSSRRHQSPGKAPDGSTLNHTLQFGQSPDRANNSYHPPQTSTPVRNRSPVRQQQMTEAMQNDLSRITLPPGEVAVEGTVPHPPTLNRDSLPGGDPAFTAPMAGVAPTTVAGNPGDLAQQLQFIVRGELRRMMEVQHQSMMAMMGALDGQPPAPVAWQQPMAPAQPPRQMSRSQSPPGTIGWDQTDARRQNIPRGRAEMPGVLSELRNLQINEDSQAKRRRSKAHGLSQNGKENIDSTLRMSALRDQADIEVYRVTQDHRDPSQISFQPKFLRMPAERDTDGVRFPHIAQQAWGPREQTNQQQSIPDMPLLHVERTVPAHLFPGGQRSHSLPRYQPQPGYFQPPSVAPMGPRVDPPVPVRVSDSPDSGIGIPLLRIPTAEDEALRKPRFGELLGPDIVLENEKERQKKEMLREKYTREFHKLQAEREEAEVKKRFGEHLLHLDLKSDEETEPSKPTITPRKSPRKTPRSISEQISSRKAKSKSRKSPGRPKTPDSAMPETPEEEEVAGEPSERSKHSERSRYSERSKRSEKSKQSESLSGDGDDESEDEDATDVESVEEEEVLHDGYAFRPGEFEAYLALEKQLAQTKDTHARIQLKTALRLQQQRMKANWKRPKVDFATNTTEYFDAGVDAEDIPMETEGVRTSEKATSITKDTGVDPIHEAVIEYNKSRQPHMLPPDIYMGLRFNEAGQQPSSDVTGQTQDKQGHSYLNVVDLDASAVLRDLREKPESDEPNLDSTLPATQQHIARRIAAEDLTRTSLEPPVVQRPSRADELTVKMFETKSQGEERFSIAVMPRDGMPDSKYAVMQHLRDMNAQLAAIDRMSNNIEREFKSTRLALHTLDNMTDAMEPPTRDQVEEQGEMVSEARTVSPASSRTLTPQPSAKSPTPSIRATARSTARSKKSVVVAVEDKKQMSTELAKVSGLSGISDIIGDMVAQGDIDLEDVGLTQREADRLVQRGAIRQEQVGEARISLDAIKQMAHVAKKHGGYDKDQLREWMDTKRHQRMEEYRRHLDELREREVNPYRPQQDNIDQSFTMKERKALAEAREQSRKHNVRDAMTKRLDEAQHLLGSILTEKPEVPPELPRRITTPKRGKDKSPVSVRTGKVSQTKAFKKDISTAMKGKGILKARDVSPPEPSYRMSFEEEEERYGYDDEYCREEWMVEPEPAWRPTREPVRDQAPVKQIAVQPQEAKQIVVQPRADTRKAEKPSGVVPKLRLSLDDVEEEPPLQGTADTTGDLSAYYRAMEAMDISVSQDREAVRQEPEKDTTPQKPIRMKPYTELVKVQRPHITRKQPNKYAQVMRSRQHTLSQSETARTSARTQPTQREMEMIYGSKRLPSKKPTETTPRRVKTYTERLQEMKSKMKYSTPVAPRSQYGSSIASASARGSHFAPKVTKPRHKPMTYVEQLQKLNEGHHKPRVGAKTMVLQKPMVKSHKPSHKPKTYAEQLQELQPHRTTAQGPPSRRALKGPTMRQRPYKDPYVPVGGAEAEQWERDSVVSGWSMGDDVRNILYDDAASSIAVGQSASYAPSEQVSDYYDAVMGDDYTASVDIDDLVQIADGGGSVSSGSLISVIDWDQVEDLIADVR